MTTVLVMTDDLGFQLWLANDLADSGFALIPAKTPAKARKLLARLKCPVDMMIFDSEIPGAERFVRTLRDSQGYLHPLPIPGRADPDLNADWRGTIRKALRFAATA